MDLTQDALHCGACGNPCGEGERCAWGVCADDCRLDGLSRCDGACVDLGSDGDHCGACGNACPAFGSCVGGECTAPVCVTGPGLPDAPDIVETVRASNLLAHDLDADGILDLVVAEDGGTRLQVLRGLAGGGYGAPETYAVFQAWHAAAAGDLDGDGDPDLVVTGNAGYGAVSVETLRNEGEGGFVAQDSFTVFQPRSPVVADLDGDARGDIVVVESWDWVSVRLAGGTSFQRYSTDAYNGGINVVRVADLDRDGRPDLVAGAEQGFRSLVLLRNAGDGTFEIAVGYDLDVRVEDAEVGDVDGDGDVDVVVLGSYPFSPYLQVIGVVRNDGSGALGTAELHDLPALGSLRPDLLLADLDADGSPDVVVAEGGRVRALRNRGDGTLDPPAASFAGAGGATAAADADGDGRTDLLAANQAVSGVEVRRGRGGMSLAGPEVIEEPATDLLAADVDGDGRADLVSALIPYDGSTPVIGIRRSSPGGFSPPERYLAPGASGILSADVDRDGRVDIVIARPETPGVLLNAGDGTFLAELPAVERGGSVVRLADVTGDGAPDLLALRYRDLRVARGFGNGAFGPAESHAILPAVNFEVGDVDGDGRGDVVTIEARVSGAVVRAYRFLGDGSLDALAERWIPQEWLYYVALAIADVDGDGAAETLVLLDGATIPYTGFLALLRGGPEGPGPAELHEVQGTALAVGSMSGGPRRDVLVLEMNGNAVTLFAGGPGGSLANAGRWTSRSGRDIELGDFDGDLRDDVAVGGPEILVYRGGCLP
ncbi:MAG TPA: FG-GAP-like repeat-containing protein [Anaeromyxobacteraceae bacterium]|nr:FG-GAP-like repeat-containing protein [Anaeromyxobacteraceae bacterium]